MTPADQKSCCGGRWQRRTSVSAFGTRRFRRPSQTFWSAHGPGEWVFLLLLLFLGAGTLSAQFSPSAYRVFGQPDLRQNARNRAHGAEFSTPQGVALDSRGGELHLYVADMNNHRVLAWRDVPAFRRGDPADLVVGQLTAYSHRPLGLGSRGLQAPIGLAVDAISGDLYVADFGNHRVLRFPAPFEADTLGEPDAVYGQPGFDSRGPNAGGVNAQSMSGPQAVAFDPQGNLWVADSGNNRILRFPRAVLDMPQPSADLVLGQPDFTGNAQNAGGPVSARGFASPAGITFDPEGNLYVADYVNARVVKFAVPLVSNQAASLALGQPSLASAGVRAQASASTLGGPVGLGIDQHGNIFVAIPRENRVLLFARQPAMNAAASDVVGQADFTSKEPNQGASPFASETSMAGPTWLGVAGDGTIFVADTDNNRVISFPTNAKSAKQVWGQPDFSGNSRNGIESGGTDLPYDIAIDYSQEPFTLYASDTNNHRVLIWRDSARYLTGDPPTGVIGQPDFLTAHANAGSADGVPSEVTLSSPRGLAVDKEGNLYVADFGNDRVLRYRRPVDQSGRIVADRVIGQPNFSSSASPRATASSLNSPSGIAIASDESLFVSDTGYHRVLQFPPDAPSGSSAAGVFGQSSFGSGSAPSSPSAFSLNSPEGVFVDDTSFLYVADTGANRVVIYPAVADPPKTGPAAAIVIGQSGFSSALLGGGPSGLSSPRGVAVDAEANLVVSDSGNNRVLVFPSVPFLPFSGGAATSALGQPNLSGNAPNWNDSEGLATPGALFSPAGIELDRNGTLYVADQANHRIAHFLKRASAVNISHFRPDVPVSPGALVSVFGSAFAESTEAATTIPLPQSLAGREVVVNEVLTAPLLFLSPNQINVQFPTATPLGSQRIMIRLVDTGELLAGGAVAVASASPGLLMTNEEGSAQGVAVNQDGTLNGPENPATKGSIITLFGTGQGEVIPAVPDGEAAPASPLARTLAEPTSEGATCLTVERSVCVAIGSSFAKVHYSGLAPGFAGLWQLNVEIPERALSGDTVPVRVVIAGRPSNIVTVSIR